MSWVQIKLEVNPKMVDELEDQLLALGACSVTYEDAQDKPVYEPKLGTTPLWEKTILIGLFTANTPMELVTASLENYFSPEPLPSYRVEIVEDKDWEREWMGQYHPMQFGERLWICPSWLEPPQPNAVNLRLDPGLAFGTGTHPTTAMCLTWLDAQNLNKLDVIDYGCGSGILAIASLLLGAKQAIAIDNDPQALQATADNAQRNHINPQQLHVYLPENFSNTTTDVLVANILAKPLIDLAPKLAPLVKTDGLIALSGILMEQADQVIAAYAPWFSLDYFKTQDGWVCLAGRKIATH
ncbi:50S ribosomal protein L11 methyltransferase [Zooshikella ganghwensis]|uniref:Ribosomal protein L11 methyltransferase n=1 Tax=Zooshikella ganghwensis TaxID=202772 RepID=A0A4P9VH87_9GAMM|nr:50S ribosomal protein L11 methyltransferase [Zooshikella ganghwensis]RDH42528.1 50S ribosomal protein L11 methyltransferase [Zooshikella ganghwensis]